jgi:hypothetical protein
VRERERRARIKQQRALHIIYKCDNNSAAARQPTMLVGGIGLALRFGSGRVVIFDEKTVISH